jgi:hypothetical protein
LFVGPSRARSARTISVAGATLLLCVVACHILYSPLGFNPTDDGLQLAFARRILGGEVPHRDFISVRPALSYLLWAPLVAAGPNALLLFTRAAAWVQWGIIAWIWTACLARRVLRHALLPAEEAALAGITFMLGVHTFPIMPWHTLDGLFLLAIGLALAQASARPVRVAAWLVIGAAPLCKQSFLPAAILLLLIARDRRDWRAWLALVFPALAYGGAMAALRAAPDALRQLTATPGFFRTAFLVYPVAYAPFVAMVALVAAWAAARHSLGRWAPPAALAVLLASGILPPLGCFMFAAPAAVAFHLFAASLGLALGNLLPSLCHQSVRRGLPPRRPAARLLLQSIVVAWASAISVAVNYPALAAGILWCAMFVALFPEWRGILRRPALRSAVALASLALVAVCFHLGRTQRIYRDLPASELSASLDAILSGAAGIRTNPRTAAMLADLRDVATSATQSGRAVAILPDCAAWWIRSPQRNPLPVAWDNEVELPTAALRQRAIEAIASQRGHLTILVTRFETDSLAGTPLPLKPRYPATQFVRTHWRKAGQSPFFELYE